jgi:hypothetical protein
MKAIPWNLLLLIWQIIDRLARLIICIKIRITFYTNPEDSLAFDWPACAMD